MQVSLQIISKEHGNYDIAECHWQATYTFPVGVTTLWWFAPDTGSSRRCTRCRSRHPLKQSNWPPRIFLPRPMEPPKSSRVLTIDFSSCLRSTSVNTYPISNLQYTTFHSIRGNPTNWSQRVFQYSKDHITPTVLISYKLSITGCVWRPTKLLNCLRVLSVSQCYWIFGSSATWVC